MKITINTKNQIFTTIGHDENFTPVLYWKIGQRKKALEDLTNFYNRFHEVLATGIQLTNEEIIRFNEQFHQKAMAMATEVLERSLECSYNNRFFTYLK